MSGFAVVKKAPNHWQKYFLKKNFFILFVQIRSSKRCSEFFKNKWVSRYLTFGDFTDPEDCSSQQNYWYNKNDKKIKKIPHTVLKKSISQISQNFCKIRSNPKELKLLE